MLSGEISTIFQRRQCCHSRSHTLAETPFIESVPFPRHRTNITPRIDYQLTKNNTLTARYQYYRDTEDNEGIGQFNLPSQGYNSTPRSTLCKSATRRSFGAKIVNETRFQYLRELDNQFALNTQPTLNVLGSRSTAEATTRAISSTTRTTTSCRTTLRSSTAITR
jgi:hypothetical protein